MEAIQKYQEPDKVFEEIKILKDMIIKFEEKLKSQEKRNESSELNNLFEALAKAQMEMEVAKTDNANPSFKSKYADLASVVRASRPYLVKHGIAVVQFTREDQEGQVLYTRLCHASGQWIESQMKVKPLKDDPQTLGSTLTYLRRYMYASLVGVVASGEDDDAETAMKSTRTSTEPVKATITRDQLKELSEELEGHEELLNGILTKFQISKLSELLDKNFLTCVSRVRQIKKLKQAQ